MKQRPNHFWGSFQGSVVHPSCQLKPSQGSNRGTPAPTACGAGSACNTGRGAGGGHTGRDEHSSTHSCMIFLIYLLYIVYIYYFIYVFMIILSRVCQCSIISLNSLFQEFASEIRKCMQIRGSKTKLEYTSISGSRLVS